MNMNESTDYPLVPGREIDRRIDRLQLLLQETPLDGALILDPVNMYYCTGTIQQGVVFVPAAGEPVFLVRRSLERAQRESPLGRVLPLKGFSRLPATLADLGLASSRLGIVEASLPLALFRTLATAFCEASFTDISGLVARARAVKSEYELALIRKAGELHHEVYAAIPAMIREGISEWELGAMIHREMMARGYTGITRIAAFGGELFLGIISFGESGNYPSATVGPDGLLGLCPAFPLVGSHKRLTRGEVIFVDTGFGVEGYFTDKTRVFSLGAPPAAALAAHQVCLEIQEAIRCRLTPGAIPAEIYEEILRDHVQPRGFFEHFMGFGSNQVPFLGHGIGLAIDEFPVLAGKIDAPLEAGMVLAVEPKKGLAGIGLVGVENTFLVTARGGECLTPGMDEIIVV